MQLGQFLASSFVVLAFRITGAGLIFLFHILLSRQLGSVEYGVYAVLWSVVVVLSIATVFGLDGLLLRELPRAANPCCAKPQCRAALRMSVYAWFIVCLLACLYLLVAHQDASGFDFSVWMGTAVALLSYSLMQVAQAAQRGLHQPRSAEFSFSILRPVVLVVGFLVISTWFQPLSAFHAVIVTLVGCLLAFAYSLVRVERTFVPDRNEGVSGIQMGQALPFVFLSGAGLLQANVDILMLGRINGSEDAGIYSAASRITTLLAMGLAAANMVTAPRIAAMYKAGEHSRMQQLVSMQAWVVTLVGVTIMALLLFLGEAILGLFGDKFPAGYWSMAILLMGQMVNALCGPVGYLATMTDHAKTAARFMWFAAIINILLNALLIPIWGIEGAAAATGCSMVVWNVGLAVFSIHRLKINPTVASLFTGSNIR